MILRAEVELARLAPVLDLLVGCLVGAVGHVVHRQVGQAREDIVALRSGFGLGLAGGFDGRLGFGDFGHQLRGERFVLRGLGLADFLASSRCAPVRPAPSPGSPSAPRRRARGSSVDRPPCRRTPPERRDHAFWKRSGVSRMARMSCMAGRSFKSGGWGLARSGCPPKGRRKLGDFGHDLSFPLSVSAGGEEVDFASLYPPYGGARARWSESGCTAGSGTGWIAWSSAAPAAETAPYGSPALAASPAAMRRAWRRT